MYPIKSLLHIQCVLSFFITWVAVPAEVILKRVPKQTLKGNSRRGDTTKCVFSAETH